MRSSKNALQQRGPQLEYMTTREAGELFRLSPKSLRNKIALGIFRDGVHYHTRRGIGLRWIRSALVAWLAGTDRDDESADSLPLAQPGGRRVA
jgi:hypothetical protein